MINLLGNKALAHAVEALSLPEEIEFKCTLLSSMAHYDTNETNESDDDYDEYGIVDVDLPPSVHLIRLETESEEHEDYGVKNKEYGVVNFGEINFKD